MAVSYKTRNEFLLASTPTQLRTYDFLLFSRGALAKTDRDHQHQQVPSLEVKCWIITNGSVTSSINL
jgi:hypothetical protein